MSAPEPAAPAPGGVDAALREEFPGLRLWTVPVPCTPGPSTRGLKTQLRYLSDRVAGAQAIALRQTPIPHAYRVFFRHVGLDPDQHHTPIERAILTRLEKGRFPSRSLVDDALLIALVETGVPVWALDDERLEGPLRLRLARDEDEFVPAGRMAVADDAQAVAELFGATMPGFGVSPKTRRARLFTVAVTGVPEIHVEEALFSAQAALAGS